MSYRHLDLSTGRSTSEGTASTVSSCYSAHTGVGDASSLGLVLHPTLAYID